MGSYIHILLLGLLPIIGELKFCGKVLEDSASIYYDDQLASEQKCVDVVIDGMHVHCLYRMECLVLNYILRTTTLACILGHMKIVWHVCFPCSPCLVALLVGKKNLPVEKSPFIYSQIQANPCPETHL